MLGPTSPRAGDLEMNTSWLMLKKFQVQGLILNQTFNPVMITLYLINTKHLRMLRR